MKRVLLSTVTLALLLGIGLWGYPRFRQVDGRRAADWVALVNRASLTVSYRAYGTSWTDGRNAQFTLDQGGAGCYALRLHEADGTRCDMGFDGQQTWYRDDRHVTQVVAGAQRETLPPLTDACLLGTGQWAGRRIVRLAVQSGALHKELAVDRQSGVMLALTTQFNQRTVSMMQVKSINYQPVIVPACALPVKDALRPVTPAEIRGILGRREVRAQWLPAGMAGAGDYLAPCSCCPRGMIALRYSDGVSTLTLFEMAGPCCCLMGAGCHMAPTGSASVLSQVCHGISVTAVGTLDAKNMQRVLDSVQ